MKILIIEDEPFLIEMLQLTLIDAGFDTVVVADGATAVSKAIAEKPDLISLDVNMPGKSGFDICRELKVCPTTKHIPVIFLSAFTQEADIKKGLALGAVEYLTKPLSMTDYAAVIKRALNVS